jgi:dipeptidyl aminopeptidase/acylaminoacyl peptidase
LRPDSPAFWSTLPSWTRDGQILFSRGARRPAGRGIFTVRPDGTGLRRIRAAGGDPAASPDGRFIVFMQTPDGANQELFVMRSNGTGVRQLTATNGVTESNPDWQRR